MALPTLDPAPTACTLILAAAPPPTLVLPGGIVLQGSAGLAGGDPGAAFEGFMAAASAGIAPFSPAFDIVGAITSILDAIKATPKILTDMPGFLEAQAAVVEKVGKLAQLVPQLAVPALIRSVVTVIAAGLRAQAVKLGAFLAHQTRLDAADARALTLPATAKARLLDATSCARANLATQLANEGKAMEPLNRLIALVNSLIHLVPGVACITVLGGASEISQAAIDALNATADGLDLLASLVPGPTFTIPGLPAAGEKTPGC